MVDLKGFQTAMASKYLFKSAFLDNFPGYWSMGGAAEYYYDNGVGMSLGYFSESTGSKSSYADYSGEYYDKYILNADNFSFSLIFDSKLVGLDWKYFKTYIQLNIGFKSATLKREEYWRMMADDTISKGIYASISGFAEPQLRIGIPYKQFEIGLTLGYHFDSRGRYKSVSINDEALLKEEFLFDDINYLVISSEWSGITARAYFSVAILQLFERPDRTEWE
jgi:hypothetical protein